MSTTDPTQYDPRYVSINSVPIEIPDSYSVEKKREALFQAESRLDMELNGGAQLDQEDVSPIHQSAVANLATYHLARPATDNADVTLGDLNDGGSEKENHAEQYLETYLDHVDIIAETGSDGQSGVYYGASPGPGGSIAVNNGRTGRRHNLRTDAHRIVHDQFLKQK